MACEAIENVHVCWGLELNCHKQQLLFDLFFVNLFFLTNSVAAAWRMLSTLATSTLWGTSHGSQLLRMQQQSGNTIPLYLATVF